MEEFDLIMRSKLQDAEEQVPQGVWQGISSRLDALEAAGKAPARHRRGWAVAALATAAALATGLFFTGTHNHNSNLFNNNVEELTAHVGPSVTAEEKQNSPLPAEAEALQETVSAARQSGAAAAEKASNALKADERVAAAADKLALAEDVQAAEEPATGAGVQDAANDPAAAANENSAAQKAGKAAEQPVSVQQAHDADPFAAMEAADARTGGKKLALALTLGGSLGGNSDPASVVNYAAEGRSYSNLQETSTSAYGIPLSVGAGIRIGFSPRWAIGTGVDYSLLSRTFSGIYRPEGGVPVNGDIRHIVQYIGIPLNLYYKLAQTKNFRIYLFGGGEGEWCISNRYSVLASADHTVLGASVKRPLWSVGGGLGLQFRLGEHLGLFLDPSARYYFECEQPKSIRTEKPFNINFLAGLRFDF